MLLMMIFRQQVGYKSNMYIDKIHYYYRLCSCVECCLSSSLELKVLLQKSHEKLAETPGVDSSDLLLPPPLAATPEPCISFSFGIHSEHSPWGAITPEDLICPCMFIIAMKVRLMIY
jgi:hypothetical protein